jgi:hypothetical protein
MYHMRRNSDTRMKARADAKKLIALALDVKAPVEERRTAAVAACLLISRFGLLSKIHSRGIEVTVPSPPR